MNKTVVKIGISKISFSLPLYIAQEKKLFEKADINVSFFSDYLEAETLCSDIVNKKLDIGGYVALPIFLSSEIQAPGSLQCSHLAIEDENHAFASLLTQKNSNIHSLADLKNKKIGIFPTAAFELWIKIILKKQGVPLDSVQLISIQPEDQSEALLDKKIDVLFTNDPVASSLLQNHLIENICNESLLHTYIAPETKGFPIGGIVFQKSFIKKNPKLSEKIVAVIDRAIEYIKEDSKEIQSIIQKYYTASFSQLSYWKDQETNKKDLQRVTDIYYYNKLFDKPVNASLLVFEPHYRIDIKNISYNRPQSTGGQQILKDISFQIKKGEVISLFGPNGSGKTTLFNILSNILTADSGTISIGNMDKSQIKIGYVFQDYRKILMPWFKTIDNIAFPLKLQNHTKEMRHKEVRDLCEFLGIHLDLESYPSQLSGGQQQLIAILSALIDKPEVLLLDEPFSAIDFQTTLFLQEKIMDISEKLGITIIFISHNIDEAVLLSKKIVLLTKKPTTVKKVFENKVGYSKNLTEEERIESMSLKQKILDQFTIECNKKL
ncbi:hypothetical protein COB57_01835 [Candidatus Peregrinibacteria bacterium]|nr:MAG: hypothetical protein COB57_01835 [Candidatus Peregrinibacteria bacterium]